jgi:predicted dehydrogenase/nucleoside-diphosphate-sugar epimerase
LTPPRLLILGGGAVVKELHIPALARLGWTKHCLCADPSERSLAVLQEACGDLPVRRADYRDILKNPETTSRFDGVIIALPNHLHEDAVARCLDSGLHVLCEKPLALTSAGCRQLARTAEQAGRHLAVGMVRRLIPSIATIREALRQGLIGDLLELEIAHGGKFTWPSDSGSYFRKENGGILVNMGVHYLDLIEDWVGPVTPVEYRDDFGGGVEACIVYCLRTEKGARVRLTLSYTHEVVDRIVLKGTRGQLSMSPDEFTRCDWQLHETALTGSLAMSRPFRSGSWPADFTSAFVEQLAEFAWIIAGREAPRVDAHQAATTLELIEWAYEHRSPLVAELPGGSDGPGLEPGPTVVTGGSGFTGGRLVERLVELGFDQIRVPVRSYRSGANVARFPVDRVLTDLRSYDSVRQAVHGARYVFHLAYGSDGTDAGRVTIDGTRNVVEAAIDAGAEVVVVVSTCSVFGHPQTSTAIDETFPYKPALGEYGHSKARAERYALARARSSPRTRIVVLNPSAIYGPGGPLFTEFPARAALRSEFCWIEEGQGKLNYTFVDNVVDSLLLAARCSAAHGERFIIADGFCTFREFLTPLLGNLAPTLKSYTTAELRARDRAQRAGLRDLMRALLCDEVMEVVNRMPMLAFPKKLVERYIAGIYRRLQKRRAAGRATNNRPTVPGSGTPPSWLADIFGPFDIEYSAAKAQRVLNWSPRIRLDEGQRASIDWLRSLGIFPEDDGLQTLERDDFRVRV